MPCKLCCLVQIRDGIFLNLTYVKHFHGMELCQPVHPKNRTQLSRIIPSVRSFPTNWTICSLHKGIGDNSKPADTNIPCVYFGSICPGVPTIAAATWSGGRPTNFMLEELFWYNGSPFQSISLRHRLIRRLLLRCWCVNTSSRCRSWMGWLGQKKSGFF